MFEYINGVLSEITPAYVVLETNGVGFLIYMANPYRLTDYKDRDVRLYVYQEVRDDSQLLYGFRTADEKQLFLKLIKVSGIGAKSAMSILANDDHQGLIRAIESDDIKYLTQFPGVGKKTAGQLVLDLKGKLGEFALEPDIEKPVSDNQALSEAMQALDALGYSKKDITKVEKALAEDEETTTDAYLRKALSLLTRSN